MDLVHRRFTISVKVRGTESFMHPLRRRILARTVSDVCDKLFDDLRDILTRLVEKGTIAAYELDKSSIYLGVDCEAIRATSTFIADVFIAVPYYVTLDVRNLHKIAREIEEMLQEKGYPLPSVSVRD